MKNILVIKNDRLGDFAISLPALNLILNKYKSEKITFVLSDINFSFSFLLKNNNVDFIKVSYALNLYEKINFFFLLLFKNFEKVYIFRPKNYYFILSFFFRKTKFIGICVKNKNILRPNKFLLKYLNYYLINDRDINGKRESIIELQIKTINYKSKNVDNLINNTNSFNLKNYKLPGDYIFIHYKDPVFKRVGWTISNFISLLDEISKLTNVILVSDLENHKYKSKFIENYSYVDLKDKSEDIKIKESNVIFADNVIGQDLANLIRDAKIVIACHGTMTILANYFNVKTIDLYYIDKNIKNYRQQYLNSFREFRPLNKTLYKRIVFKEYDVYAKKIISFTKILLKINE
jgi:ADP-heptose:LPS heptosyltransferase